MQHSDVLNVNVQEILALYQKGEGDAKFVAAFPSSEVGFIDAEQLEHVGLEEGGGKDRSGAKLSSRNYREPEDILDEDSLKQSLGLLKELQQCHRRPTFKIVSFSTTLLLSGTSSWFSKLWIVSQRSQVSAFIET